MNFIRCEMRAGSGWSESSKLTLQLDVNGPLESSVSLIPLSPVGMLCREYTMCLLYLPPITTLAQFCLLIYSFYGELKLRLLDIDTIMWTKLITDLENVPVEKSWISRALVKFLVVVWWLIPPSPIRGKCSSHHSHYGLPRRGDVLTTG